MVENDFWLMVKKSLYINPKYKIIDIDEENKKLYVSNDFKETMRLVQSNNAYKKEYEIYNKLVSLIPNVTFGDKLTNVLDKVGFSDYVIAVVLVHLERLGFSIGVGCDLEYSEFAIIVARIEFFILRNTAFGNRLLKQAGIKL